MLVGLVEVLFFVNLLSVLGEIHLFVKNEIFLFQELCDIWICRILYYSYHA
jgi:hypothetical protein